MGIAWLPLAIVSYLMQAVNGAIDRAIVHKEVTPPIVISLWVAVFSILTFGLVLLGFVPGEMFADFKFQSPSALLLSLSLLAGFMSQAGLFYMFTALEYGEATRVLSSLGAVTPIVALVSAYVFLGERLGLSALLAFGVLVSATIVLSLKSGRKADSSSKWILSMLVAAVFLGSQSVVAKYVFDNYHFISAFALTGLGAGIYALFIALVSADVRKEISAVFGRPSKSSGSETPRTSAQVYWIIGNSALGGIAVIILNLAIKLGSPTLVNALRGVQYAGVFLIALLLAQKYPGLLDEDLSKRSIILKLIGIVLIVCGVLLLAI